MFSKVPLGLFLFSLVYLAIILVLHFRDSLHHTRAIQHELQRAKDVVTPKNHSKQFGDNDDQERLREPKVGSVTGKIQSTFSHEQKPDPIPLETRAFWMRQANQALWKVTKSPCPFAAFGSVVVNHTDTNDLGDLICIGVNSIQSQGNPTLHGEIAAINNCNSVLTSTLSRPEALAAFKGLSLYTNGEPCPMCASAIRWAGFKECIYGTSIDTLTAKGWDQIQVYSHELFERSITREYTGTCEPVWMILENSHRHSF